MVAQRRHAARLGRGIALLVAAGLVCGDDLAGQTGVRAYLTPGPDVGVGSPFVLNVEITGTQQLDQEPQLPDLSAFAQYISSSTQTSMQVVNGRSSISLIVQYRYQALTEGSYRIPGFFVVAGGETLRTQPLELPISARGSVAGDASGGIGREDVFISSERTKERVRDGEPFVVEYRIWTRVDVSSFNFTRVPEPEGFWVEDITPTGQPQVEQLVRDGQTYASAVIRRVALVPAGAGTRTIEPIVLEAQVRTRAEDPFDRFFGFRSLMSGSTVPVGVVSEALTIDVEPLPTGAPEPFSGMVGSLSLRATLDRDSVDANEAVTLTVRVEGDGNIRAVPEPELDLPADFEVFPPEVSESVRPFGRGLRGEKTFEYVLIPRAPGLREIPSLTMSYLDEASGAYDVATAPPLPLTVGGTPVEGPAALVRGGVAELRQDIRFIHLGAVLRPAGQPLHHGAGFWLFALLPMVAVLGAVGLRRHRDLLEGDVAYARGRRARGVARRRLADARRLADGDDARAFYSEVDRALRGLVSDKLNLAEAGLQTTSLEQALVKRGVGEASIAELTACLEHCDRQRFAPPGVDAEERSRFLDRAGALMGVLEREIGR